MRSSLWQEYKYEEEKHTNIYIPLIVLILKPSPSIIPAPIANGFLSAPPSSTPITSWLVKMRKLFDESILWTWTAWYRYLLATQTADGSPSIISFANEGPDSRAYGWSRPKESFIVSLRSLKKLDEKFWKDEKHSVDVAKLTWKNHYHIPLRFEMKSLGSVDNQCIFRYKVTILF